MSAERGWIGDPQPLAEWHDSHYSRCADEIAERFRNEMIRNERAAAEALAIQIKIEVGSVLNSSTGRAPLRFIAAPLILRQAAPRDRSGDAGRT
jgi:hypothetical protein